MKFRALRYRNILFFSGAWDSVKFRAFDEVKGGPGDWTPTASRKMRRNIQVYDLCPEKHKTLYNLRPEKNKLLYELPTSREK